MNRRIAHKWDTGWDFGTFKKRKEGTPEDAVPSYWVRYASVGQLYTHELQRGSYGFDQVWVILAKVGT